MPHTPAMVGESIHSVKGHRLDSMLLFRIVYIFMFFFIAELVFCGPIGLMMLGISIRKFLLAVMVLSAAGLSFYCGKFDFSWCSALLVIPGLIFWGGIIPLIRGVNFSDAMAESLPVLYLLLIIPVGILDKKNGLGIYFDFAHICVSIVSGLMIFVWLFAVIINIPELAYILRTFYVFLSGNELGLYIGPMPDGSFRVMWIVCIFYPFLLFWVNRKRISWLWSLFYLFASYVSGTRAIMYISVIVLIFNIVKFRSKYGIGLIVILFFLVVGFSEVLQGVRLFEVSSDLAIGSSRSDQFASLLQLWGRYPIFGAGLGAHAEVVRSEALYSYELTYVALFAKVGIVGTVLILSMVILLLRKTMLRWRGRLWEMSILSIGFIFITGTNPYLFNAFGFVLFVFLVGFGCLGFHGERGDADGVGQCKVGVL